MVGVDRVRLVALGLFLANRDREEAGGARGDEEMEEMMVLLRLLVSSAVATLPKSVDSLVITVSLRWPERF